MYKKPIFKAFLAAITRLSKGMNPPRRVHVGCGPNNRIEGWWNVDTRRLPGVDEVLDVTKKWPFDDLDYIYGEHFLEHLPLEKALTFLENAGSSLKIGGKIRLSTPNLEWVIYTHFRLGSVCHDDRIKDTLKTNRAFHGWGHQFLWTEELLRFVLDGMNLNVVGFYSYGESDDSELVGLERHGKYRISGGFPSVIIAEASRGSGKVQLDRKIKAFLEHEFIRYVKTRY